MYVILTNHVNWHKENLRSDRENTGTLKIQFEWATLSKGVGHMTLHPTQRTGTPISTTFTVLKFDAVIK